MKAHGKNPWKDLTRESLEAKLRDLPPPPIPATLERRLLAAIPASGELAPVGRRFRWRRAVGLVGLAAAVILILALPRGDGVRTGGPPLPGALSNTSPRYILGGHDYSYLQETRPCYILPPISD
jgi:hypothetical protein